MLLTLSAVPGVCVSTLNLTCQNVCNVFSEQLASSYCSKNVTMCVCVIGFVLENQKGKVQGTCRVERL